MPNRIISTALIGCAAWAAAAYGQINDVTTTEAEPTASVGLKDAFDGKFLIGAAGDLRGYSDAELANIKANDNIVTPENCMKPERIHPGEDTYNWATPRCVGPVVRGEQHPRLGTHFCLAFTDRKVVLSARRRRSAGHV